MDITIVTNGNIASLSWLREKLKKNREKGHFIICADGATKYLKALDFPPHLLMGDMDSIDPEGKKWIEEKGVPLKKFPSRKDRTDTEIALEYSLSKEAKTVEILGAFGSRMDHTLGNVQLLEGFFNPGIDIRLIDEQNEMWLLNKHTKIRGRKNENFSILAVTESVLGITLKGFEYPLENHTLSRGHTLGISNIIRGDEAEVSYEEGMLLGIIAKD